VILAILQFLHKNFNDVDVARRKLFHLKATHPKLYKNAKDEVLAEKLIDSLRLDTTSVGQSMEGSYLFQNVSYLFFKNSHEKMPVSKYL
jgi:hypothetical protein